MAINNQPTIQPQTVTGIFTKYIAKTLPLAFDESMSYYECICALLEYLNETIVPDINNTNDGLSELQSFYLQLQDYVNTYFDNLDVQEEINNKLDAMTEDGTLTTLIGNYIQPRIDAQNQEISNFETSVNNSLSEMSNRISSVASGSPLVASSTAGMTNTSRIYVNTTDGKWYYYDGDSWEIGGTYQSTGISDNSISLDKLDNNLRKVSNYKTDSKDSSGWLSTKYTILATHTYVVETGIQSAVTLFTSDDGSTNKETITSTGFKKYIEFTPTQNANYLRMYTNNAMNVKIYEKGTFIDNLNENNTDNIEHIEKLQSAFNISPNLVDESQITDKKVINNSGTLVDNNDYKVTDYIDITNIEKISFKPMTDGVLDGVFSVVLYDENKTFLQRISQVVAEETSVKTYTIPRNATYIRLNIGKLLTNVMVVSGEVESLTYVPYGIRLLTESLPEELEYVANYIGTPTNFNNISNGQHVYQYKLKAGVNYTIVNNSSSGYMTINSRETENGDNIQTLTTDFTAGRKNYIQSTSNTNYLRVYSSVNNGSFSIYESDLIYGTNNNLSNILNNIQAPLVKFNIDKELKNVSSELSKMDYSDNGRNTIMPQIYTLFDSLVTNFPSYVTKTDVGNLLNISYPTYANGVESEGDYLVTPTYKTYMYSFVSSYPNSGNTSYTKKKKLLLVGGTHGNELAAPFNLYYFAYQLCNAMSDENFFKLQSAFDIYIIPCLNGYGMYHKTRTNANGVNINRNYPVTGWTMAGENTENFTGYTAGSEFETQLIMGITDYLKPDMAIDHHNYGNEQHWQFYSDLPREDMMKLCYESLVECCYVFKDNYPQYFGTGYSLLQDSSGSSPSVVGNPHVGTTDMWWNQNGVYFAGTIEICQCINYSAGVYNSTPIDSFGETTFKIAEYTLRNQILRYGEYTLQKLK